jgi:hypothetical protein
MRKRYQLIATLSFLIISVLLIQIIPVTLADPYPDPNEPAVPDNRDFRMIDAISNGTNLTILITFYGIPVFDEFLLYIDANNNGTAEVQVKCHKNNFEIYKQTQTDEYTNKVFTGVPGLNGKTYQISIPQKITFGKANTVGIWTYESTGKDRLPDSGTIAASTTSL